MEELSINSRQARGITTLDLTGNLLFGESCDVFQEFLKKLTLTDSKKMVLNLDKVSYCDSTGLGCLVSVLASVRKRGGQLKLVNPSPNVQKAFGMTRLSRVLEVYGTEAQALASFK